MKNKSVLFSIISGFFVLLPILVANRLYVDDIGRTTHGYLSWDDNGRPLTSLIMKLVTTSSSMIDVSPLPQLLGMIVFCAVIDFTAKRLGVDSGLNRITIVAATVSTPIIFENLSYKFDALTMLLSASTFMVAPLITIRRKIYDVVVKSLLIVAGLSMYQANMPFYVISSICFFISLQKISTQTSINETIKNIISLLIGYFIYSAVIVKIYVTGNYSLEHSKLLGIDDLGRVFDTIIFYIKMLGLYYNGVELYSLIALLIIAVASLLFNFRASNDGALKSLCGIIKIIAIPLAFFSVLLPISLLKYPVLHPRVLMPFCGVVFLLCYLSLSLSGLLKKSSMLVLISIIFPAYVFSFIYGNALAEQNKFEEVLTSSIYNDLSRAKNQPNDKIFFGGNPLKSPVVQRIEKEKPLISELIYPTFKPQWMFANMYLNRYGIGGRYSDLNEVKGGVHSDPVISAFAYDIYKVNEGLFIKLK